MSDHLDFFDEALCHQLLSRCANQDAQPSRRVEKPDLFFLADSRPAMNRATASGVRKMPCVFRSTSVFFPAYFRPISSQSDMAMPEAPAYAGKLSESRPRRLRLLLRPFLIFYHVWNERGRGVISAGFHIRSFKRSAAHCFNWPPSLASALRLFPHRPIEEACRDSAYLVPSRLAPQHQFRMVLRSAFPS